MTTRRGSSGAQILRMPEGVWKIKSGDERLQAQARWLLEHQSSGLPRIVRLRADGYVMELLCAMPTWLLDHKIVLHVMFETLERDVWRYPAVVDVDLNAIRTRVAALTAAGFSNDDPRRRNVETTLHMLIDRIAWSELRTCLTHGDSTFDNVMFRGSELVMIDPIPATTTQAVPDLWSADVGHIIRSVLGFERVRYDDSLLTLHVKLHDVYSHVNDENEWQAASFWSIFHLLRTLPYQPTTAVREEMRKLICSATNHIV